jgi:SPP1 family predicted phage head-tail adaptor
MDRRITIQTFSTAQDAYGQPVPTWTTLATVWAEFRAARGIERFLSEQHDAQAYGSWRIRYRTDVAPTAKMRVVDDHSVTHDITSVVEIGRREGWELHAFAHVPQ